MAIYTAEQIAEILAGKPAVDPNIIWRSMAGASWESDAAANLCYKNMWYTYENAPQVYRQLYLNPYIDAWEASGGSAVTPSATEMLNVEPVFEEGTTNIVGSKAASMPATTTNVGSVKSGALSGRMPIGTLVAATAIGAGIGLKERAQHKVFWDDLTTAVFSDLTDGETLISKPGYETKTAQIIWRTLQDGSIQGYCDKRSLDAVINRLYQFDCFNVIDQIDVDIDHPGLQPVSSGALDPGYAAKACSLAGASVPAVAQAYAITSGHYPSANVIECQFTYNTSNHLSGLALLCWNVPDGNYLVRDSGAGYYLVEVGEVNKVGSAQFNFDDTGAITSYDFLPGQVGIYINVGERTTTHEVSNTGITCNIAATFKPKNENIIYNGTDQLPPADPSAFWTTFAAWLANGFTNRTYDPLTNQYVDTTYVPLTAPETNWQTQDITGNQPGIWTGLYDFVNPFTNPTTSPVNNPSPWIFESLGNWQLPDINIPPQTPWDNNPKFPQTNPGTKGDTPSLVAPTSGVSSGSKLFTVYNPTQNQVDGLGAYLWTQNIIELISQFFKNSPLEAIISLHMVYCTPSVGNAKNIILGYLDSGVSANVVTSQYVEIECGDQYIPELYGNALDYTGVSIQVFLPFIGYKTLKTHELMGKRLRISYKIDVYTGTCLAMLYAISPNTSQLLYTFEGNCSVQIPLTASDRTRLIAGLTTAGVSAFTGNPAGVVGGIASIGVNIDRSGGFSGNAGAMNVKKPFIVITRAVDAQASHYNTMYGYPTNKYGPLKNFRGFTRVKSVHVDIPDATLDEINEIHAMLTEGIVI